jgi:hypothetical protein
VVLSLEGGGAFEVQNIGCVFDDAQKGRVAVFVPADFAKSVFGKKATFGAGLNLIPGFLKSVGEVFRCTWRGGKEVKSEALG